MDNLTMTMTITHTKCFEVSIPNNMLGYVYTTDLKTAVEEAERIWGNPQQWNADKYTVKQLTPETSNG
jgi:hypothetical protein